MSCPDCFKGSIHEGTPRGRMIQLHGLETYITEPDNSLDVKGIIVMIPDAFGLELVNNKLLADHYADNSQYLVYLPDFMKGMCCKPRNHTVCSLLCTFVSQAKALKPILHRI